MHDNASSERTFDPDDPLQTLYTLSQLPSRPWMPKPNGRKIGVSSVYRWTIHGPAGGPALKTIQIGGRRCTCDAWAIAFFNALSGSPDADRRESRTPSARARAQRRAERELAEAGI